MQEVSNKVAEQYDNLMVKEAKPVDFSRQCELLTMAEDDDSKSSTIIKTKQDMVRISMRYSGIHLTMEITEQQEARFLELLDKETKPISEELEMDLLNQAIDKFPKETN